MSGRIYKNGPARDCEADGCDSKMTLRIRGNTTYWAHLPGSIRGHPAVGMTAEHKEAQNAVEWYVNERRGVIIAKRKCAKCRNAKVTIINGQQIRQEVSFANEIGRGRWDLLGTKDGEHSVGIEIYQTSKTTRTSVRDYIPWVELEAMNVLVHLWTFYRKDKRPPPRILIKDIRDKCLPCEEEKERLKELCAQKEAERKRLKEERQAAKRERRIAQMEEAELRRAEEEKARIIADEKERVRIAAVKEKNRREEENYLMQRADEDRQRSIKRQKLEIIRQAQIKEEEERALEEELRLQSEREDLEDFYIRQALRWKAEKEQIDAQVSEWQKQSEQCIEWKMVDPHSFHFVRSG